MSSLIDKRTVREHVLSQVDSYYDNGARGGSWVIMSCPLCEAEGNPRNIKLNVNVADGWFFCFRCGIKGSVPELKDDRDALTALFHDAPEDSPQKPFPSLPADFRPLHDEETGRANRGDEMLEAGHAMLQARGVPPDVAWRAMAGVAKCGPRGMETPRLVFPVWGFGNWCTGYDARILENQYIDSKIGQVSFEWTAEGPKYYKPPGFDRAQFYNAEALKIETNAPVFVVEGIFDALAVRESGIAVWGKPTAETAQSIALHARRPVVFALDRDAAKLNQSFAAVLNRAFSGLGKDMPVGYVDWVKVSLDVSDLGDMALHPLVLARLADATMWMKKP